jgi:hypothetical protein
MLVVPGQQLPFIVERRSQRIWQTMTLNTPMVQAQKGFTESRQGTWVVFRECKIF